MATIPPLRPLENGSSDGEPAAALRGASPVRTAAAIAAAAALFLAIVVLLGVGRLDGAAPAFLENALGPEEAEAPLTRTPAPGVGVRIHDEGYTVTRWGASVSVVAEDVGDSTWRRHVHGVTRETEFGAETIVVDGSKTEEYLTVSERQGERTWRWKLATRLVPRIGRDGSVGFLDPTEHQVTGIVLDPVRILDTDGKDVTPAGLRWDIETDDDGSWLVLRLDDSDLPLPYVIDPAVSYRTSATANNAGGSTSLTLNVPAGTAAKDLLVVHLGIRNTGTITAPSGWTQLVNDTYNPYLRQAVYYRVATGSEPASYQWTFGSTPAAGGMSAFYGVKTSNPIDVADTSTATGNSGTVSASSITTTANESLVLALFSARNNTAFSQATGMTERYESRASGGMSVATDSMIEATASTTGTKTSTVTSSRWSGTQVSFRVDDVAPTGSVTDPGTNLSGTATVGATANDTDSAIASVLFQGSPANSGTWTDVAAADTTFPYSVSFDTTLAPDGLYDLRVIVTDAAGNAFTSAVLEDRRVDNTAPSSTTGFPAASTTYSASGWNAGCGTSGFCGTHSDAGSGVQGVEVSIRRGSGNYWSGGSFSSASEVWNAAGLAGGNWSYAFAASSFPADGSYTVRVRATDAAGNQEAPHSRTFTIDTTTPQTTIGSNPADPTAATSADFTFSSSEGGSTFQCRIDGGVWGACTSPRNYAGLSDGSHTFDVRATDAVGNQDSSPASYTWLVDTTAPSSTVTFPAAAGEYNAAGWDAGCATSSLCGTHSDGAGSGVAAVEVSVRQGSGSYWDGTAFASASEVWNAATLAGGNWSLGLAASDFPADGDYTVRVRAGDEVANPESPSSRTFTIDTADPSAGFGFPAAGGDYTNAAWNAGCATSGLCGTHGDGAGSGVAAVEVSVLRVSSGQYWDGAAFSAGTETFHAADLAGADWSYDFAAGDFPADGQYAVHVRATDEAGNVEGGPTRTFRIDNANPSSTTSFPGAGGVYNVAGWDAGCATSGLCGTYSDAGSGVMEVELSVRQGSGDYWDGTGFTSASEVWNDTTLAAGNWSYAFDAADFPADGDYTVRVRARDAAGNTEGAASRTLTFDSTAPETSIDSTQPDPSGSSSSSFSFSSDEPGSTFECALDGGAWGACSSPKNYVSLAEGGHTFDVRATDPAGNTDDNPASIVWSVDTVSPSSTTAFPVASGSYTTSEWNAGCPSAGLCGTYDDGSGSGVVQVEVSIRRGTGDYWDGTGFTSASEVWNDATLAAGDWSYDLAAGNFPADGDYTVRVRARDDAGNVESASSRTFTYDATDPASTTTFPADAGEYNTAAWEAGCTASGLCGTYSDATSGVAEVELSIRKGAGDYWDSTGFASATEVWTDATLAAGDWTYALDAADLPADGDYTVRVRALDTAGNVESVSSRTFTYDTAAPETTIDSGPAPVTADPDASLEFDSDEAGSTFECRLDGGSWSPCTSEKEYEDLADGSHTFDVRATDGAGNTDATPASRSWLVDTTAPGSTTSFPAAAGEYNAAGWDAGCATAGLCGTYGDGGAGSGVTDVEVSVRRGSGNYWDGAGFTSAGEVWNDATLAAGAWSYALDSPDFPADGAYTVRVRATDAAGLVETPSSRTFDFDTTDPSAGFAFPAAGGEYRTAGWNAGCATVGFCGPQSDAGSGVAEVEVSVQRVSSGLYWDGDSFDAAGETFFAATLAGGDWSYAFPATSFPSDGQYVVQVRATDDAGNTASGPSRTFRIDNADPSAAFAFPAAGERYNTSGWNAGCAPNGVCGTHSDSGSGVAAVEISLKQVGADLYWDGDSFDAAGETFFAATLAGGDWSYAFPAASFPADGAYTLHVRATDDAGNAESGPTRTFTYDTAEPQTTIDSSPSDPTSSASANFDFSANESGSTFECRLDGGAWGACTSPESHAGLADGEHTFEVRAIDEAGNTDATPASFTWTVDTTAPSSAIGFPDASGEYNGPGWNGGCATAGICGTHGDGALGSGIQSVEISVRQGSGDYWNGASFSSASEVFFDATLDTGSWSRPFPASNFPADGSYTVRVVATDEAGNTNAGSSRTFTIDRTAPTGSLTAPADGAALRGASVAVSSDSADTGSGVDTASFERRPAGGGTWTTIDTDSGAPYTADWNTTALTDGDYDLRVLTTDQAGNTTTSPLRTVTVDNTAPSAATLDALPGAIRDGHELTGSGADAGSGVDSVAYLYCEGAACSPSTPVDSSTTGPDYSVSWSGQPADGQVRVLARVTDRAGNSLDSDVQSVTVDNTNPTGSLTAPADGASVSGSVAVSSDSADTGSGVDTATFERRPAGGGTWTTIDTDTGAPYTADWNTTALTDGDYDLRVLTTDQAGNTTTSPPRTVSVDNAAPTVALTAPSGYVNAADPDPFTVTATTPDGDVVGIELFRCSDASAACASGTWVSLGVDSTAPYEASWALDADGNRALRARAEDAAGNTGADVVDVTIDRTSPSGALTAPDEGAYVTGASVAVSSDSADTGSGVDTATFERRPAGGGTWTTIDTDTGAPYTADWNTTALTDGDYDLRVLTTDQAGNTTTSPLRTVTVDNSAPSTPVVTLTESSPHTYVSGAEIFVNADEAGSFDVDATSADPHSGLDKIRFPGPSDDSSSPYQASYQLAELSGAQTVIAFNRAGLTAGETFTVTPDTNEPTGGSVSYPDGYDADGSVTIVVDAGSDALSGIAPGSAVLERRTSDLSDGSCAPFAGAWSTVTSPDTIASGLCAQYRYRVSDRVGNEAVYTSGDVVEVDLVAPSAPALTLSESSPYAHVSGTEVFVNTDETGSYDVEADSSDGASGLEKIAFPGGNDDTSAPYAATYDFDDLLGTETVTAHDRAGLTASSQFDVTEDVSAPSTTDDTGTIGSDWQNGPVTVTLDPTDARSGVAATYFTIDGSLPTTSSAEGTSVELTDDGVYTIRYFSVDRVGNVEPVRTAFSVIRIDGTDPGAPTLSFSESSPYAHVSGNQVFVNTGQTGSYDVGATASDPGSGIDRIVFPGGVEDSTDPYSTTYALGDLTGGQTVTAHDLAGNTASDSFTVTPDTAPPAGGSVSYPDGWDADGVVTIAVAEGTDALSGVSMASAALERRTTPLVGATCDAFTGPWLPATSPNTVASGTCARYRYRVSDRVGNEVVYTLPLNIVKVDTAAPQTAIDVAPTDPSADASPDIEFSSDEPGSTFQCRLDSGAWNPCTSPASLTGLADGNHTYTVRATDAAGNTDTTPATHTWTVDTAAPQTAIDVAPADPSQDDAPVFEFSSSEPGSTFECRVDGGLWEACSSPETAGLLADGPHTFDVRASDGAGNVDGSPATHAWTVDTTAPDTSFTSVPSDPSNDPTPDLAFSSTEPGSSFQCALDGGAWSPCTSPLTVGPLADGSHTVEVSATDPAGNSDATPAAYTWITDGGAPSISITEPNGFVNAADADPYTVRATTSDGDVTSVELFSCSDDSAACATGTWVSLGTDTTAPYEASWPLDADGNRALRAVVVDIASNSAEDVVDVTIDRTVPATTIGSAPSDPSADTAASFTFNANEGGATFECRLDGGAWTACSSPQDYTGLSEGAHDFSVRASDAAGNVEASPAAHSWTVDTLAPETAIDVAPTDPSADASPDIEFSSDEPGSTFQCRLDSGAWNPCTSPASLTGLADGNHTYTVRATDAAGNTDTTPATHTWTVDTAPPGGGLADPGQYLRGTIALTASPSDTGAGVQSVAFQVSPADAGAWTSVDVDATDPYGASWDTTAVADGLYDLRVVVTDNASNATPSAVVEDRLVDNTAPTATMDDPGAYLRATVTLTSTSADAGSGVADVAYERSPAGVGLWTPVAASWVTTGVADGLYDLRVTVTDNAGNSATSAPVANRRVDNTRPSLTSSTPVEGSMVASAGTLAVAASEDVTGIVGAQIDGAGAPAPTVSGSTVTWTQTFGAGPHVLAGELEDLAGNRRPIRVHFTVWSGAAADYPYLEKNSEGGIAMELRSPSDTATVRVPSGAWTGAPAGDWLVLRVDPQPAAGVTNGFQPAGDVLNVTAYWALTGTAVTSFALPLEIDVDNSLEHVVPATFENGAWRPLPSVPDGGGLPASWNDGFERDGTDVRILTRHLTLFTLLEDVQAPRAPGKYRAAVSRKRFSLYWAAASDNSGLISAYRVYANGRLVKTLGSSARSVAMGRFKQSDKRSFQVAAVDEAGNVGARTKVLRIVPRLTKLKLAAAKKALRKRGFKPGKVRTTYSVKVPKGKVIAGITGLRVAGTRIPLVVSKGSKVARRPLTTVTSPSPLPGSGGTPPPAAPAPAAAAPAPDTAEEQPAETTTTPILGVRVPGGIVQLAGEAKSLTELRQELGFGLLAAAFSIAFAAVMRARRPTPVTAKSEGDELLWDQRFLRSIGRAFRRIFTRG